MLEMKNGEIKNMVAKDEWLELIAEQVDKNGVLNMLYKRKPLLQPEVSYFELYREYPDKTETLHDVLPTTARKIALDLGISNEKCLEIFGEEKQVTEEDIDSIKEHAVINGYLFRLKNGLVKVTWLQLESVDVHEDFGLTFYYLSFNGINGDWHEIYSCNVHGSESIEKLTLYKEAIAVAEIGEKLFGLEQVKVIAANNSKAYDNKPLYIEAIRIGSGIHSYPIEIRWETTSIDDPNEVINMWKEVVQDLQKKDNNPFKDNTVLIGYTVWDIEDYHDGDNDNCLIHEFVELNSEGVIQRSTKGRMNSLLV